MGLHIQRVFATLIIAIKRTFAQRGLALAALLGLIAAIALVLSIPLYSEAVYYRVLSEGLFSDSPSYRGQVLRPPVAMLFRYTGSFTGPIQWQQVKPLDTYFNTPVFEDLKLSPSPEEPGIRLFNTGLFGFFLEHDIDVVTDKAPEFQVGLTTISDYRDHIKIIDGSYPAFDAGSRDIDILVSQQIADKMGLQIGETTIAYDLRAMRRYEANPARFTMRISGVWEPQDPKAEFWEYSQLPAGNMLLVSEDTFTQRISSALDDEIYGAMWYMPMHADEIYVGDVSPLLLRIKLLERHVTDLLAGTTLYISPVNVLEKYQESAAVLNVLLFTFSIPIISLVLTFILLIVTLSMENQRNQVAALRSRGASALQVVGITALESGLLGFVALLIALPVSLLVAYTIGQTRSFLDFSLATDLRVGLTWASVRYGLLAYLVIVTAQVVPTITSARYTIVTYKMERARRLQPPWWQKFGLDFILSAIASYGLYSLNQRGTLAQSVESGAQGILTDPLLFLVPALSLFAFTLLVLRFLPLGLHLVSRMCQLTRSVGLLMAARQLARAPGLYTAPLALLILTLGLSTYSASLAATMDHHLYDQQRYRTGADMSLVDAGEQIAGYTGGIDTSSMDEDPIWQFLPAVEYTKLPGITTAT
ncbi:MAG: hypothetical protein P1S60_03160, partial [Anaerolineae bacterium]|nr:hypothetical protein [Anaerolineae bacterium]